MAGPAQYDPCGPCAITLAAAPLAAGTPNWSDPRSIFSRACIRVLALRRVLLLCCCCRARVAARRCWSGVVRTHKMKRTIVIRRDYLHFIRKYQRYEKRHSTLSAHCSPCFRVSEGDQVTVGQCRPLSKTVKFNVIKVDNTTTGGKGVKLFSKF